MPTQPQPIQPLPANADLDRFKSTAKQLRDLIRAGDADAIAMAIAHHPHIDHLVPGDDATRGFKLSSAQLVVARYHGFDSWPRLKRRVELIKTLARSPHAQATGGRLDSDLDRADELLRLACLTYGSPDHSRPDQARLLLDRHPGLATATIHTMAATGEAGPAAEILAEAPELAHTEGGPFAWAPLLYATYSRFPGVDTLPVARILLDAGADPNTGYLWDGLVPPFTALTGALGGGERGEPPHPRSLELARMLLEAGADANDAQAIYNRGLGDVARDDTDFLALLLEHGLGRGDGGPWYRLLAPGGSTRDLLGEALQHAAESGLLARTGLLLGYGADPNGRGSHPVFRNRTAYQGAVLHGHTRLAEMLEAAGAEVESIDPITRFVGACLAGDRHELDLRHAADPLLAATVRRRHPDLISRAAELGRPEAIRLLVELGYDVNHRGRTTALHEAAYRGHDRVVVELLELGADPTVEDIEHHSTPEGWARFAGHAATAATLAEAVSRWRGSVG